jgi:hypothetical protein
MTTTTAQRVQAIIDSLQNKKAGFVWLGFCNSPTAFIKTWALGRAGRRLAALAADNKKTAAKGVARGRVIARHAVLALEKLAKKIKAAGAQPVAEFIHFVLILGAWAARAVAGFFNIPTGRGWRRGDSAQTELNLSLFGG